MRRQLFQIFSLYFYFFATPLAHAADYARVIDGDSLQIGQRNIRLYGIDAPELHQSCSHHQRQWPCGRAAAKRMRLLISGDPVSCTIMDHDRYGREVDVCSVERDGKNIELNREMVVAGWAFSYRHYSLRYAAEEDTARAKQLGMWDSIVMPPWDWRRAHPWHKG